VPKTRINQTRDSWGGGSSLGSQHRGCQGRTKKNRRGQSEIVSLYNRMGLLNCSNRSDRGENRAPVFDKRGLEVENDHRGWGREKKYEAYSRIDERTSLTTYKSSWSTSARRAAHQRQIRERTTKKAWPQIVGRANRKKRGGREITTMLKTVWGCYEIMSEAPSKRKRTRCDTSRGRKKKKRNVSAIR